jgi:hypothetical protein
MKTKTPQNNARIKKNITRQCRNENKNTTKHGKNNEKTPQHNVRIKKNTTTQCRNENKNTIKQCKYKEKHHNTM